MGRGKTPTQATNIRQSLDCLLYFLVMVYYSCLLMIINHKAHEQLLTCAVWNQSDNKDERCTKVIVRVAFAVRYPLNSQINLKYSNHLIVLRQFKTTLLRFGKLPRSHVEVTRMDDLSLSSRFWRQNFKQQI